MSKAGINRNLPNDAYEAATNANNPSASNPFITEVESAVGSASLLLYPTSAASAVPTYNKLVNTISDPDYDDPAVNSNTGVINATSQLIAEFASEEGVISGNPGIVNVNTIGNIRRVSGTGTASFYFEVYHRNNLGTETLIGTSNTTGAASNAVYEQYFASCLINATNFGPTDRVVTKWYANRLPGGSDPTYEIQLGGATPVKITFPVPFVNLPSTVEELNDLTDVTTGLPDVPTNADDGRVLYYDVDTNQWISDDIANISNVVKDCKTSVGTGSIPKGTPVYLAGYDNDLLVVEACDAANAAKMPCIGVTAEALDSANAKKVVSFGKIQDFDTSLWADGTELYVAVGGGFTTTRPTGTAEIQRIAVVLKGLSAAGGSIKVFNTSRTAGLPNLANGNTWVGDANGYPVETPLPTGTVDGSGTLNYLPKWTPDGDTLGNSLIQESVFNTVGVNVTPNALILLNVEGNKNTGIYHRNLQASASSLSTAIYGDAAGANTSVFGNVGARGSAVGATQYNVGLHGHGGSGIYTALPFNLGSVGVVGQATSSIVGKDIATFAGYATSSHADDTYGLYVDVINAGAGNAYVGLLKDGTEGAGKVLTSDAQGRATWQTPAGGGGGGNTHVELTLGNIVSSGGATSGFTIAGSVFSTNELVYFIDGANPSATKQVYLQHVVPDGYTGSGEINVVCAKLAALTTFTITAYINDIVDATINASNIEPTATSTWETKTVAFGSTLNPGDVINYRINFTGTNGQDIEIKGIYFSHS